LPTPRQVQAMPGFSTGAGLLPQRRHVASRAREGGKDFAWGAFAVPIEGIIERGAVDPWRSPAQSVSHAHPSARILAGFGSSRRLRESLAMIAGSWSSSFQSWRYPLTKSAPLASDRLKRNYPAWRPLCI
jgi:hypothetical protein